MGKESRARAITGEAMLTRADVPVVAVLALMDALLIDMERTADGTTGDREMRTYRADLRKNLRNYVEKYHSTFKGRVTDDLVTKCDRYLCRVQDAMDTFFDDLTAEDLAEMERVKAKWPQHVEIP